MRILAVIKKQINGALSNEERLCTLVTFQGKKYWRVVYEDTLGHPTLPTPRPFVPFLSIPFDGYHHYFEFFESDLEHLK